MLGIPKIFKHFRKILAKLPYARPRVTKYQVHQFFMSTKNLHIRLFTFIPSCLVFLCQGENFNIKFITLLSVAIFLTKVHIC